jgi:hypothetical protein
MGLSDIAWRSQLRQDRFVAELLQGKRDGTFVDIGAGDPEQISNTVVLEREFGWRGLLCDLAHYDALRAHRPTALVLKDALVPTTRDWADHFLSVERILEHEQRAAHPWSWSKMKPLTGWIDYLSLDLEPPELTIEVLLRLPADYKFRVATVEHDEYRDENGPLRKELVRTLMAWRGYLLVAEISATGYGSVEDWFIHQESGITMERAAKVLEEIGVA